MVLLQATPPDVSLQDVLWVGGGIVAVVIFMLCRKDLGTFVRALRYRYLRPGAWSEWLERVQDWQESAYTPEGADNRIMSKGAAGSAPLRTGTQGGSEGRFYSTRTTPVQHQAEVTFEDVCDFLLDHNLTDEEGVDLLALVKRKSGYFLSANKIRDAVGGSDAEIKARVRKWRGASEPAPAKAPPKPPVSPIAGRAYDPKLFHSDNPELRYEEPAV